MCYEGVCGRDGARLLDAVANGDFGLLGVYFSSEGGSIMTMGNALSPIIIFN
jgi:hypothetical protein